MTMDQTNACFELMGAAFMIPSLIKAYKEKVIQGVSILTPIFFSCWGIFNVFYYPSIFQFYSGMAAIMLFSINLIWLYQVIVYSRKNNELS